MFILTCQIIQLACMLWVFYLANQWRKAYQNQITALAAAQEGERSAVQLAAQYALERDNHRADLQTVCNTLADASKAPEGALFSLVLSLATAQCKTFQDTACAAQRVLDGADPEAEMFGRVWVLKNPKPNGNPIVAMAQAHVGEIAGAMARRQEAEQPKKRVNITRRKVNGRRETSAEARARIAKAIKQAARRARA